MTSQPLPKIFSEDVVWDSAKFNIVQNMTADECHAIAKWAAWQLRVNSPAFSDAFRDLPLMYDALASCTLIGLQQDTEESSQDESDAKRLIRLNERRRESTERKLEITRKLIDDYRQATGYRAYCVLARAAGDIDSSNVIGAAKGMRQLNKAQESHFEAMQICEKLEHYLKVDNPKRAQALVDDIALQHSLLDSHIQKSKRVFDNIDCFVEGRSIGDFRQDLHARCPQVKDEVLNTINEAGCVLQTFRATNKSLMLQLTPILNRLTDTHFPDAKVFPNAA